MKLPTILSVLLCFHACLAAMPAQVVIIRHAEKPPSGETLSTKGRERAAAYVPYFTETKELLTFGPPAAIYAMGASKDFPSKRPVETVTPLSQMLKTPAIETYTRDDYKKMVEEIKSHPLYPGRTVLICWEHDLIPEIARAFGALQTPAKWSGAVFDRNWIITWNKTGKASFQNMPQRLMFGDSPN